MFKYLLKKEPEKVEEVVIPCGCEHNDNEQCDLISQLRGYQDAKKKIEDEIKMLDRDNRILVASFIEFLQMLEDRGFMMDSSERFKCIRNERNMIILEHVIDDCSFDYILRVTEELKLCKTKTDIINNKEFALNGVKDKIRDIKLKLDIE